MAAWRRDLDVVLMALYKHVTNKSDLLDGMVETLIASPTIRPTRWWKAAVRISRSSPPDAFC